MSGPYRKKLWEGVRGWNDPRFVIMKDGKLVFGLMLLRSDQADMIVAELNGAMETARKEFWAS